MEAGLISIGIAICGFLVAYMLGKKINEVKILRAWFKKGIEIESKRDKIRQKYIKLRSRFKPSIVFRRANKPSKAVKAANSGDSDS